MVKTNQNKQKKNPFPYPKPYLYYFWYFKKKSPSFCNQCSGSFSPLSKCLWDGHVHSVPDKNQTLLNKIEELFLQSVPLLGVCSCLLAYA